MSARSGRLFHAAAAMLGLGVVQRGIGLVSLAILSRLVDVRGVAAYAFTQSSSQTFFGIARLGVDAGLHAGAAGHLAAGDTARLAALIGEALTMFLAIALAAGAIMVALADPIAGTMFGASELRGFMIASAGLMVTQTMCQFCYTAFAGINAFVVYSRIAAGASLATAGLVVVGAFTGGTMGAVTGLVAGHVAMLVLLASRLRKELRSIGVPLRLRLPRTEARRILTIGFPFYAGQLALVPAEFASLGMLSQALGVDALGELRITQALLSVAAMAPVALSGPMITYLTAEHRERRGCEAMLVQLKAIWVLALAISVGMAAFWPLAVEVVFGGTFPVARAVGAIALAGFIPTMLLTVFTGALVARSRAGALLGTGIFQAAALLAGVWMLAPRFGLAGYLAAQGLAAATGAAIAFAVLRHQDEPLPACAWMRPLLSMSLALALLLVADTFLDETALFRLSVAAAALALLALIVWTSVVSTGEREHARALLRALLDHSALLRAK